MQKFHHYQCAVTWTGNRGEGTSSYQGYGRNHQVVIPGKPVMECSADTPFLGDVAKLNPEDMLLSALSSCHMLWFLHLCADAGIIVTNYTDHATGTMLQHAQGGHFTEVILHPQVTITDASLIDKANALHEAANKCCFIANSCNFPVKHEPVCSVENKQ